jgi:tripartite-type tricarboxylate transporter receptor subunit TctC
MCVLQFFFIDLPDRTMRTLAFLTQALVVVLALGAGRTTLAQTAPYPSRTVTVIVPFSAGGSVDAAARMVLQNLGSRLGQPVIVENVPGASGTLGTQRAVRAEPDGHTLLFAVASPINVAPLVSPGKVRYDAVKDLTPVAMVATSPFVLIGRKDLAATDTAALMQLARDKPGSLSYGTDGVGTSMHLTVELIKLRANVDMLHVPYRAGPQVLTELSGGLIDLAVMPVTLAQPFIRDNRVRAYGVTSAERWKSLPDVPTLAETDALKDIDVESWYGLLAPAGVDAAIVERLSSELAATMADADLGRRLAEAGLKPVVSTRQQFAEVLQKEREAMAAVVSAANIKVE